MTKEYDGTWINISESSLTEANAKASSMGISVGEFIIIAIHDWQAPTHEIPDNLGENCPVCKRPNVHCSGC